MPYQKVKYELYSEELGLLELTHDPLGWQNDNKSLERSAKSESFFTRFSDNISFIREGADYIRRYLNAFGTKGNLFCRRFEIHPVTDEFVKVYDENLDLESYQLDNDVVSIGFLSGGLNDVIKAQMKEKFELQRTTSIEDEDIGALTYENLGLNGHKIFLRSFLENNEAFTHIAESEPTLGVRTTEFINDHDIQYESDDLVKDVIGAFDRDVNAAGQWTFQNGQQFYGPSDRQKTLTIRFKGNPEITFRTAGTNFVRQFLVKGIPTNDPNVFTAQFTDDIVIAETNNATSGFHPYDVEYTITVNEGETLNFVSTVSAAANAPTDYTEQEKGVSIYIEEDSTYFPTKAKGLLFKDALKRVLKIMTGRDDVLKSDFFTTGQWEQLFITSGILLREFPEVAVDEDGNTVENEDGSVKTNGIITSLDELLSIKAHLAIGWGVERINGIEYFRIEPLTYFFQNKVTLRLQGKYCPTRSIASEFIYGSVSIGNAKSGSYEEQQGLYEYNALNSWTTSNIKSENKYNLDTTLRTDPIGAEHTRRKAYSTSPTLDTSEDRENWVFHVKPVSEGNYTVRLWEDDFAVIPKQVYSPETAYNLLLSPLRSLERHGWYLNSSLFVYPNENILFADSTGNANMITQLPGEVERGENQPYRNGDLSRARFVYEYLDFEFPNTFDVKLQVNSFFKDSNNNLVPNYYGMVEFTNENEELEYGWILKSTENDLGSFRLIKANR